MIGLRNNISAENNRRRFSPDLIPEVAGRGLIGWWDFTDGDTLYSDGSGTTKLTENNPIVRVNNKAYRYVGNKALGEYSYQGTANKRPLWRPQSGAHANGNGARFNTSMYLTCLPLVGGVDSDNTFLSYSTINSANGTWFFVTEPSYGSGSIAPGDGTLWFVNGEDVNDYQTVYVDNDANDCWQFHSKNNTARTNTLFNTTKAITTNKTLSTLVLDEPLLNGFYINRDTSDGNGGVTLDDYDIDLKVADNAIRLDIGTSGTGNSFAGMIFEIIGFNRSLTPSEINHVNRYLMSKHKI